MEDVINIEITDIISEEDIKETIAKVRSLLTALIAPNHAELSEEEKDVLEKTALAYCYGAISTDIKDLEIFHPSNARLLFAYGSSIPEAAKKVAEKLSSAFPKNRHFSNGLVIFYFDENTKIVQTENAMRSFCSFFDDDYMLLWNIKSTKPGEKSFISIICE